MPTEIKRLPATFYQTPNGAEPVREWLRTLSAADRRNIGHDIGLVEFGWPVGMPLCRPLGDGLWEIRSHLSEGKVARVIFCVSQGQLALLHAFIKKTQKTPDRDRNLALKRKRALE
jgi:phage-related protein